MEIKPFPFQTVDWSGIEPEEHAGTTGTVLLENFQDGGNKDTNG